MLISVIYIFRVWILKEINISFLVNEIFNKSIRELVYKKHTFFVTKSVGVRELWFKKNTSDFFYSVGNDMQQK